MPFLTEALVIIGNYSLNLTRVEHVFTKMWPSSRFELETSMVYFTNISKAHFGQFPCAKKSLTYTSSTESFARSIDQTFLAPKRALCEIFTQKKPRPKCWRN
jgi:hypothetical protein